MNIDNAREQLRMQGVVNTINGLSTIDNISERRQTFPYRLEQEKQTARGLNLDNNRKLEELNDYVLGRPNREAMAEEDLIAKQRDNRLKLQEIVRNSITDQYAGRQADARTRQLEEQARGLILQNDAFVEERPLAMRALEAKVKTAEVDADVKVKTAAGIIERAIYENQVLTRLEIEAAEAAFGEWVDYPFIDPITGRTVTKRMKLSTLLATQNVYNKARLDERNRQRTNSRLERGQQRQEMSDAASAEFNIQNTEKTPDQRAADIPRFNALSDKPYIYRKVPGKVWGFSIEPLMLPELSQDEISRFGFDRLGIQPGQLIARDATRIAQQSGMNEQDYVPQLIEMLQVLRRKGGK